MRDEGVAVLGLSALAVVGLAIAFMLGAMCGRDGEQKQMQSEAIERGFAEHDAKTGEWKWKE